MVEVAVGIPWRGGCPERERGMEFTRRQLSEVFPGAPVSLVDAGGERFSRAASRNKAMKLFPDADVVILHDACNLVDPDGLHAAVTEAADGRLWFPFTEYRSLTQIESSQVISGFYPHSRGAPWALSPEGGVWVMRPQSWWKCGGMDERCIGWGWEDSIFLRVAHAVVGHARTPHTAWHLWHPHVPRDYEDHQMRAQGEALYERYGQAVATPGALEDMIAENLRHQGAIC
ncbi:galactosyltransferase-related protein [Streptomyces lavendulae]|uniref:galactosyltransferase-related protein n=1 Tax=Streptomyces lavendulae TaxID=1914 RepID=UPI0037F620E7